MQSRLAFTFITLSIAACGGQTGDVAPPNCDGPRAPFDLGATTPLGFSGAEVLANVLTQGVVSIGWIDSVDSNGTFGLGHDAVIQDGGLVLYHDPFDNDPSCAPRIDIPVELTLATDDGRLNESLFGYLAAHTIDDGRLALNEPVSSFSGTVDLEGFATPETWDANSAAVLVEIDLDASGMSGQLSLITHREDNEAEQLFREIATF